MDAESGREAGGLTIPRQNGWALVKQAPLRRALIKELPTRCAHEDSGYRSVTEPAVYEAVFRSPVPGLGMEEFCRVVKHLADLEAARGTPSGYQAVVEVTIRRVLRLAREDRAKLDAELVLASL